MNDFGLPLSALAQSANAFAAANGVQVEKQREDGASSFECAPISLLPNAFPAEAFSEAEEVAPLFNLLVDRVSRDKEFLDQTLGGGVAEADPFTAKLLELYQNLYPTDPYASTADRLGIQRSDYMLNQGQIKQVELNTIASSFASLSTKVAALHNHLLKRFGDQSPALNEFLSSNKAVVKEASDPASDKDPGVPVNPALQRLPFAMSVAVERYQVRFQPSKPVAVMFVVQEGETNTVDQRMLEFQLFAEHGIPVIRKSLTALDSELKNDNGVLSVEGYEIAVVYFRAGYAPTDYPNGDKEWAARSKLEASRATKCPSLGYHLAGTKKVQQELARPKVLERFFPHDEDAVTKIRRAFAGLFSLGDDATDSDFDAVQEALNGGHSRYVLKPQREGGGYNYYGDNLKKKLSENVETNNEGKIKLDKSLGEFILMERLFPPEQKAILLRSGKIEGSGDAVSELGCFGTIIVSSDGSAIPLNEYAGFLLRTKFSNVDEGGVASGFATLSSPYLC